MNDQATRMYAVDVLADSVSPFGDRITTLRVVHPRFILAEVNTHRMLSRNSASSRAIPTERLIEAVEQMPFIPETFNARVKGMGVGDPLKRGDQEASRSAWISARDQAVGVARYIMERGVDKSRVNRLLEPFMWHTAIITATEWENFLALRTDTNAQPEFQIIAGMIRDALEQSVPVTLDPGEWHLPLVDRLEYADHLADEDAMLKWAMISSSRCARVSYDRAGDEEPIEKSLERAQALIGNGHMSTFEHACTPFTEQEHAAREQLRDMIRSMDEVDTDTREQMIAATRFLGNVRGWRQVRKMIKNEDNFARLLAASAVAS